MRRHNPVPDDQTIEQVVFEVLRERWGPPLLEWFKERFLGKPVKQLQKSDRIIRDVWKDGNDASYFLIEVQKRLGITIPPNEWLMVSAIQDVIELFKRHKPPPH